MRDASCKGRGGGGCFIVDAFFFPSGGVSIRPSFIAPPPLPLLRTSPCIPQLDSFEESATLSAGRTLLNMVVGKFFPNVLLVFMPFGWASYHYQVREGAGFDCQGLRGRAGFNDLNPSPSPLLSRA